MSVKIVKQEKEKRVSVHAPYNAEFVSHAKTLGGSWNPIQKSWVFSERALPEVKKVLIQVYGTDGETTPDLVDIQVTCLDDSYDSRINICGVTVAATSGRDDRVKLSKIQIVSGAFSSGGSRKNYCIRAQEDTSFILRDVSKHLAKAEIQTNPYFQIKIIEQTTDTDALMKELETLEARKVEILKKLNDIT